ncbi:heterodisulfide reductase-related iron-sulfur binding cluster, partial [Arsenicicoccus sp. UBA2120]|uniref:heterodisulfide reductase-related iron-sulfur binding cluster n=1 Tax=Arsenicicoccus sp. UBA2120 TaxID=1946055 RepID=UPI00257EA679
PASSAPVVTYHDPCYLGRHNNVYAPPRELIGSLPGVELREMPRHGETSFCCGAGGARMWMEEKLGTRINMNRTEEALATGADRIAVGCPFCRVMLSDGVTAKEADDSAVESVEVVDVAQMLLAAVRRADEVEAPVEPAAEAASTGAADDAAAAAASGTAGVAAAGAPEGIKPDADDRQTSTTPAEEAKAEEQEEVRVPEENDEQAVHAANDADPWDDDDTTPAPAAQSQPESKPAPQPESKPTPEPTPVPATDDVADPWDDDDTTPAPAAETQPE